ncbi:MAG: hydroxymethylglutaryl-CoA synthase [Alphaproteobacteria bacterium]|nr:hydroxymethylglutaryl-CoA synthase [Alphaproteobacteria bacterium]
MKAALQPASAPGVIAFGHYVPYLRVDTAVFAEQWGVPAQLERIYRLNGRNRVAVNAADEDTVTLAVAAAERALATVAQPTGISALLVGSESHPYAVKPTSVIVSEALGLSPDVFCADLEFACKGGSAAMLLMTAMVRAGMGEQALAIGADCPQSAPGSLLEASVGAGACAMLIGPHDRAIATVEAVASAASDATDFWRRDGARYPSVVGKFSVDEGYMAHSRRVAHALFEATGTKASDYAYCVFHQPYAALPSALGKSLGFSPHQIRPGLIAARVGNAYSASCLLALCAVFEQAASGDRILVVSFGSGAGSDGLVLSVTDRIDAYRKRASDAGIGSIETELGHDHADWLTYGRYADIAGKLAR